MNIAHRLREARLRAGYDQSQLGALVGLSQRTISKIETGGTDKPRNLEKLASVLQVSPEWLQFGINPPLWVGQEPSAPLNRSTLEQLRFQADLAEVRELRNFLLNGQIKVDPVLCQALVALLDCYLHAPELATKLAGAVSTILDCFKR